MFLIEHTKRIVIQLWFCGSSVAVIRVENVHMSKFKLETFEKNLSSTTGPPAGVEPTPVRCPVNCNTTGTLTQYKSSVNGWSQVSFSEFWDEILNAKDQTVYQIVVIKGYI